jgi:Spy/CpxP family protein refolding chaperone
MLTKRFSLVASILVAASLALGGCASAGSSIEADENVASNSEAAAAADANDAPEKHGMRGHPLISAALKDLDLSAEQRKTIEAAAESTHTGQRDQMKAFQKALADDIRAGKVDEASIKAKAGDMEKAHAEHRAAVVKAVETLHATLTPAQRTQLVASIKDRMAKHAEKGEMRHHGKKHDKGGPDGEHHARRGGPMMFMLHGIDLRDDQKKAIEAAMPPKPEKDADDRAAKFEEHRAKMDAALEAFKADKFDAAAALPEHEGKHPMAEHFVKMLQAVVPILDADQRAELAQRIEEGPRMGHHGKHGKHGPGHRNEAAE